MSTFVDGTLGRQSDQGTLDLSGVARIVTEEHRAAPAAAVAAALRRGGVWHHGLGAAGRLGFDAGEPATRVTTPFDLASVSKPFTALAFARLVRAGVLGWREPLADALPETAGTASADVPLELLLAHRSGLEAHRELFAPLASGGRFDAVAARLASAGARRPDASGAAPAEGFAPVYSDLGYLLLGAALAARTGLDLDALIAREVTTPLRLDVGSVRQLRARRPAFASEVAPTEIVAWRGGTVRGVVHDENAWALAGDGAAGHAGLFGDAASVAHLGVALLEVLAGERDDWLTAAELAPLVRTRPGGSLLAGFDRRSGEAPLSGARFGARTFGHLGYTGTSLWIDPDAERVGVLLTNRVHPTRVNDALRRARPAAYDALVDAMDAHAVSADSARAGPGC